MRYKYYYCEIQSSQLIDFLNTNQIRYRLSGGGIVPTFVTFSLWSSSTNAQALVDSLADLHYSNPIITVEYTQTELNESKLLVIRPKNQSITITNGKDAFAHSCVRIDSFGITRVEHEWQIGTLAIAKEPSVKTSTALWASDSSFAEIYADSRVYELAASNELSGINFKKVLLKDGTYSNKLYQLTSQCLIQREMIATGYGEKIRKCPICGKEQFCIDSSYQLHLNNIDTIPDVDFYATDRFFGDGIAEPLYLVSQRFYQLLKQNNLARNVNFSPVIVIS